MNFSVSVGLVGKWKPSLSHESFGCKFGWGIIRRVMKDNLPPIGSQQEIDALVLEYHRQVANRLLNSPEAVIERAQSNLERWMAAHEGTGSARTLEEWKSLLTTKTIQELITIMTEDSDEGQRLRSSTPFTGILSPQERQELRDRYEETAIF